MRAINISSVFFLIAICSGTSCIHSANSADTFTITGRLVTDCSNTPIPNYSISILTPQGSTGYGSVPKDIGDGTTDSNGYFSIICQKSPFSQLDLFHYDTHHTGNQFAVYGLGAGIANPNYNWGNIYTTLTQHAIANITITRSHGPNDTLLIGTQTKFLGVISGDKKTIYPMSGTSTQTYTIDLSGVIFPYPHTATLFYGIGQKDFDSSFNSYRKDDPTTYYHIISIPVATCGYPAATAISIP